jgi:hypothetical protein
MCGNPGPKGWYLKRREELKGHCRGVQAEVAEAEDIGKDLIHLHKMGKIGRLHGGKFVCAEECANAAGHPETFLTFNPMPHAGKSMRSRMDTADGAAALCLSAADGIEDVLEPDKEIVTFRHSEEMLDERRYCMPREDMRPNIGGAGRKRILPGEPVMRSAQARKNM